jgi:hypothetical protein
LCGKIHLEDKKMNFWHHVACQGSACCQFEQYRSGAPHLSRAVRIKGDGLWKDRSKSKKDILFHHFLFFLERALNVKNSRDGNKEPRRNIY